ncbi:unnamed protein product [Cylicocyclus nassatus]|uniref:Uncharacterized protein n=1 Tax=Cylicocyclus nassatus TaxID=53992 RepID=A0AA36GE58_CYLNA|nr:unnamed protein product [Cylicocyclus nassatus]
MLRIVVFLLLFSLQLDAKPQYMMYPGMYGYGMMPMGMGMMGYGYNPVGGAIHGAMVGSMIGAMAGGK